MPNAYESFATPVDENNPYAAIATPAETRFGSGRSFDVSANGGLIPSAEAKYSGAESSTGPQRFLAGAGKAFVDIGRGAGQLVGAVSNADVQASRERDAPLLQSGMGRFGNIMGNVAAFLPTAAIPGVNTYAGAAALGGAYGALQPSTSLTERATNTLGGADFALASQGILNAMTRTPAPSNFVKQPPQATANPEAVIVDNVDDLLKAAPELNDLPKGIKNSVLADAARYIKENGSVDATSVARRANMIANNVTPTRAMVSRNPADWTIEENLRRTATNSTNTDVQQLAQQLNDIRASNDQALGARLQAIGGNLPQGTQEAHGMAAMQAVDDLATASQKVVGELYDTVSESKGAQVGLQPEQLLQTLDQLKDNAFTTQLRDTVINRLKTLGALDKDGNLIKTLTVDQAGELRKYISSQTPDFANGVKLGGFKSAIIRALDSDVIATAGEDAFSGARAGAASRFEMLGNPATQKLLNAAGELSQGRTAQTFIKSQVVSAPVQDVASLIDTLQKGGGGGLPDIRAGVLQHLGDKAINPNSGQFSGAAFNKALAELGPEKLNLVFGSQKAAQLRSLARASLDATFAPPYSAVNYSNSGTFIASLLDKLKYTNAVPIIGKITRIAGDVAETNATKGALRNALAAGVSGGGNALRQAPAAARSVPGAVGYAGGASAFLNYLKDRKR